MPRLMSITARLAAEAEQAAEVPVVLIAISGAGLTDPVYLSSDPTVRLSTDPLIYGTRHRGQEYQFVIMGAMLPDDLPDSPPKTTYVFENVTADMAAPLRAIPPGTYASVDVTLVLASSPDVIEYQGLDMRGVHGTYDGAQVTLEVSREPQTSEPWPAGRLTKARFPGVHPL